MNNLKQKIMHSKNIILIIALLFFSNCNSLKNGALSPPIEDDRIVFQSKKPLINSNHVTRVECDEFVSNALNRYNIEIVSKVFIFLDRTKDPFINMHDSSFIDTVYTFSNSNNKIQFYRAAHKDFIINFDVMESKFNLTGNVKTGISKDQFMHKFQIDKQISDVVQVVNSDGNMKFLFYFENNRLKRIKSDLYFD